MRIKYGYLLIGGILLVFGSCVARPPEQPATIIQVENPGSEAAESEAAESQEGDSASAPEPENDGELIAYQQYTSDYLAALAATGDLAEAEWNTFIVCRAASIAQAAQTDAEANNTGIEAELVKRLRAINKDAKARAEGKRFYAHDAEGASDFKDPAPDVQAIVKLLQEMQEGDPSLPLCTQNAGSLWRQVDEILESFDNMARTDPKSVPVRIPDSNEVANDAD